MSIQRTKISQHQNIEAPTNSIVAKEQHRISRWSLLREQNMICLKTFNTDYLVVSLNSTQSADVNKKFMAAAAPIDLMRTTSHHRNNWWPENRACARTPKFDPIDLRFKQWFDQRFVMKIKYPESKNRFEKTKSQTPLSLAESGIKRKPSRTRRTRENFDFNSNP